MNTTTQILEGPRVEPAMLNKMDTSLEQDLVNLSPNARSMMSPCSVSSETIDSTRGCRHNKLVTQENYNACFHCGAYVPKNGVRSFKSTNMNYQPFFSPKDIYETMTRRSLQFNQSANPEYAKMRQTYVEWILELAEKFKISQTSSHLAILLLDFVMFKDVNLTQKLQLYAPICLLIAAKTIELDERIPFIPRLRRYANPTFSIEDYRRAELQILDMVDWNAQFSPAFELIEFLMCQGVLFSTDEVEETQFSPKKETWSPEVLKEKNQHENITHADAKTDVRRSPTREAASPAAKENNENSYSEHSTSGTNTDNVATPCDSVLGQPQQEEEPFSPLAPTLTKTYSTPANFECYVIAASKIPIEKKVDEILVNFETSYAKISTLLLKDIDFIEWEPRVVSAATITFLRHVNKISSSWNPELEAITQLTFAQVSPCFELINKKYNAVFNSSIPQLQSLLNSPDANRDVLPELKLFKANTTVSDKPVSTQPKVEVTNKIHLVSTNYNNSKPTTGNLAELDPNVAENKPLDRKPASNYQAKTNVPAASSTSTAYNYLRDDLRYRTKYGNGTINTELPRNPLKNPVYPPGNTARFNAGLDHLGNPSVAVSGSTAVGTTMGNQYLPSENYLRSDILAAKNPIGTLLPNRSTVGVNKK